MSNQFYNQIYSDEITLPDPPPSARVFTLHLTGNKKLNIQFNNSLQKKITNIRLNRVVCLNSYKNYFIKNFLISLFYL